MVMKNICNIDFMNNRCHGVSNSAYDINRIDLAIIPLEKQKTGLRVEIKDTTGAIYVSAQLKPVYGIVNYTVENEYWSSGGTMKVRLTSYEGNSDYVSFSIPKALKNTDDVIVKYSENNGFTITAIGSSDNSINIDMIFPVGCVITNGLASFDPNKLYEGTVWKRIKGRVIVGVDEDDTEFATTGKTGGSKEVALTIEQMPSHKHNATANSGGTHSHGADKRSMGTGSDGFPTEVSGLAIGNAWSDVGVGRGWVNTNNGGAHTHDISVEMSGGGKAHNNLQPYITKYVWERTA